MERLWQLHAAADPGAVGGAVRRERLAAALTLLAAHGTLRPAAQERPGTPPLPRFIDLTPPTRLDLLPTPTIVPHHWLAWVISAGLSPAQRRT
jgi:hypothetical protein